MSRFKFFFSTHLTIFLREEAQAIVEYLNYKKKDSRLLQQDIEEFDAALSLYWNDRSANAPTKKDIDDFLQQRNEYIQSLSPNVPAE